MSPSFTPSAKKNRPIVARPASRAARTPIFRARCAADGHHAVEPRGAEKEGEEATGADRHRVVKSGVRSRYGDARRRWRDFSIVAGTAYCLPSRAVAKLCQCPLNLVTWPL